MTQSLSTKPIQVQTLSTMRLMLFLDGRRAIRAWPVVSEYIRPNG